MKKLYTLAISSFAVNGSASLKTFITILGDKVLPEPTLLLNGLTNMLKVHKFDVPFKDLLISSIELALNRNAELILYVGYLGNPAQATTICEVINQYKDYIKTTIVDPVCGDHGKTYVSDEIITEWPKIVSQANIVFPNITELKILTGHKFNESLSLDYYAEVFKNKYPETKLVVTSTVPSSESTGVAIYGKDTFCFNHKKIQKNYGGTGDALVSQFILNHFYKSMSFNDSLELATNQTYKMVKNSFEAGSDDLIYQTIPNNG